MGEGNLKIGDGVSLGDNEDEVISVERKSEIAKSFAKSVDKLSLEERADLSKLGAREIFSILTSEGGRKYFAMRRVKEFPSQEVVELLMELRSEGDAQNERAIDSMLFDLTHSPESSASAIRALRELEDPRAIKKTDDYTIQSNTIDEVPQILKDIPSLKQEDFISKSAEDGAVFTLDPNQGKVVCMAVAKQLNNNELHIAYIRTAENARKQGYATAMFEYLLDQHASLSCSVIQDCENKMLTDKTLIKAGFKRKYEGSDTWIWHRKQ